MRGQDVRVLQDYLSKAGYDTGVDGQFGTGTRKSVKAFESGRVAAGERRHERGRHRRAARGRSRAAAWVCAAQRSRTPTGKARRSGPTARRPRRPAPRPEIKAHHRLGQRDRQQAVQVRRRSRQVGRQRLRLLGLGVLRTARRGPARPVDALGQLHDVGRARRGDLGDHLRERRPHVHDRGGAAVRHERAALGRRALDDGVAAGERLHRPPAPTGCRPMRRLVATLAGLGLGLLAVAPGAGAQAPAELCSAAKPGTQCQPGNNRQTPGGGDKASHEGWPAISGVFWKVLDGDHLFVGGSLSDELLGHHGSDVIRGGAGADVIWGDWDPVGNGPRQHDRLWAGPATTGSTRATGPTSSAGAAATTSSGPSTARAPWTAGPATTGSASATATSTASRTAKRRSASPTELPWNGCPHSRAAR